MGDWADSRRTFGRGAIDRIPQLRSWSEERRRTLRLLAQVFPFKVTAYQLDLIDWTDIPNDPIFRLVFPQPEMLDPPTLARLDVLEGDPLAEEVRGIHAALNPHPAGQLDLNAAILNGERLPGIQHKYRETVLFFPKRSQTCPSYCTYCFRWPQFIGDEPRMAAPDVDGLIRYLNAHPEVTDLLITGGDPMIMRTQTLAGYLQPILDARPGGLTNIRIGTKTPASRPHRFVSDDDADELLRLFESVVERDLHLAMMIHYTHPRELSTPVAQEAVRRIRDSGAVVRSQSPIVRHVNDDPGVWADMWRKQVHLGIVPYYMFVLRDTGARAYFEVPLAEAHRIYMDAYRRVSGLGRTVRGPVMSTSPGKVLVQGMPTIGQHRVFSLAFLQARDPSWVGRTFFARYDPEATWFNDLEPTDGVFFFHRPHSDRPNHPRPPRRPAWTDRPSRVSTVEEPRT